MSVFSNKSHPKRQCFCGECKHFGYEDIYGNGYCLKDERSGRFSALRSCDEEGCDLFSGR